MKLNRMKKYFPKEEIVLVEQGDYRNLSKQCRGLVSGWEVDLNMVRHDRYIQRLSQQGHS